MNLLLTYLNPLLLRKAKSNGTPFIILKNCGFSQGPSVKLIENLVRNAADAMEESGRIDVRLILENGKVVITLEDSGKGIPKNKWKTVFKPGYTTKARGCGLGLSLVKRIVEEYHKGHIQEKIGPA
jgi:signal transduction histidine kinase